MIDKLNRKWRSAQEVQLWVSFWSQRNQCPNSQISLSFIPAENTNQPQGEISMKDKCLLFTMATNDSTQVHVVCHKKQAKNLAKLKVVEACFQIHSPAGVTNLHWVDIVLIDRPDLQANFNHYTVHSWSDWSKYLASGSHLREKWI